ncbi:MAG: hypothetical protein KZQ96_20710 [Candidatus Thiodiazotropha sp. (ex Lucinoma borealis)]|nr:hypothetical protein [Candidatus Thiodiazotropha sp. (ex Lucinoma borealis)]
MRVRSLAGSVVFRKWPVVAVGVFLAWVAYVFWSPGLSVRDGRHDLGRNGIWLQHGWLGANEWFYRNGKQDRIPEFRGRQHIDQLASFLNRQHVTDVFPHVAPARRDGGLPQVDYEQVERFLDGFSGSRVLPWIGGVLGKTVSLADSQWRHRFVASTTNLLAQHPRLAGIHLNIEPCPSGDPDFLRLLDELRQALSADKTLSVAAFPPPTFLHPFDHIHWDKAYFGEVSRRADQIVVMMYDTGLPLVKPYRGLAQSWTRKVLRWTTGSQVLFGVPTYDDAGVGYHHPSVENLENALSGIHAGLAEFGELPEQYQGIAIYSEWETDDTEWDYWAKHFMCQSAGANGLC